MKIVHVTPFYYPIIGGVENVAQRVAEYMAYSGNEVYVLTYNRLRADGINSLHREEIINNVHVIRLKPYFAWSHGTYSSELPKALRKLAPDLIHVHAWRHPHVFQVARLKDELGFKAILHGHAPFYKLNQLGMLTWIYHKVVDRVKKASLKKYDVIIALTPHEKYILIKRLGVQGEKIVVIPNGITAELGNCAKISTENFYMVLYLGRISKSKNLDLLVKAIRNVKTKNENVKLVMAGPDEGLITSLNDYALKHSINFQYLGIVSDNEKSTLYQECTIFAHPALYEGFGITLLEAQAFGKPCVITGEGGQVYVAPPRRTSLHVKPSPRDMGQAISLLLSDKELYRELSDNAKEWSSQHTWSRILPKYDSVYNLP